MNSGKTLDLLTKSFMLRQKGYTVLLAKSSLDDRNTKITSRIGLEEECVTISSNVKELFTDKEFDYLLVDEAQFLSEKEIWDLSDLVDYQKVNVICYGIKLNWKGELFTGANVLFALADRVVQMESFCKETGNPSLFHHKISGSDLEIETGYEDVYETVSRKVWKEKRNDQK